MPLFTSSQIDQAVAKATSEMNTSEDWETIMDIVDKVQLTPNGPKDCLRSIIKRLNSNVPHHIIHALTLLDVCIKNCGKKFHLQVCSKDFEIEVKKLLNKKSHPIVVDKLKIYLETWSEMFKNDSELSLMVSLYNSLKYDKEFESTFSLSEVEPKASLHTERSKESSSNAEEEDLAKAIELSLKDSSQPKQSSLYPSSSMSSTVPLKTEKEPRKVRALYDFIAAEDNELTFKEGELLFVLDDTDTNWWKGSNHRGEGLFPANFVTSDLNAEKHENVAKEGKRKSVQFDDDVKVKEVPLDVEEIVIEEAKIDTMLHMLHEADPTGNNDPDELLALEDRCLAMGPLIDKELVQIDRRHASLSAANHAIVESLNMYEALMKDFSPHTQIPFTPYPPAGYHSPPQQHIYMNYSGTVPAPYHSAEAYQPMHVPSSGEHFQVPVAGSLPNLQSGMMPNSQPHIPYGANLNSRIPQDVSSTGGNYASLPSREPSGIYYGDVANSMQHNTASIPIQHQPHVMKLRD